MWKRLLPRYLVALGICVAVQWMMTPDWRRVEYLPFATIAAALLLAVVQGLGRLPLPSWVTRVVLYGFLIGNYVYQRGPTLETVTYAVLGAALVAETLKWLGNRPRTLRA